MRLRSGTFFSFLFFLWALAVLLACYKNGSLHPTMEDSLLDEFLLCLFLAAVSTLAGNRFLTFFCLQKGSLLEETLFSFAIGHGLLSLTVFSLAALDMLYYGTIVALLGVFTAIALSNYHFVQNIRTTGGNWNPCLTGPEVLLISLLGIFVILTLFNTLTPPVSRDALIHHLALPKLYLKNHGLVDVPFSHSSYYPPLLEMLFLIGMEITSDIAAKLIHFSFYGAALLLTLVVGRDFLPRPFCLVAVCLFGSLPVVFQVSSLAYVDLGLTFYTIAALTALLRWHATGEAGWFCLTAIMIGFAVGCKYNGLIVLAVTLTIIAFVLARNHCSIKKLFGKLFLFLLLALSVNILWMGRNIAYTGNPLYPQGARFIGKPVPSDTAGVSQYHLRTIFYGETGWDQILLPWNLSTKTKSKANFELDGVINPIFLIVLPGLFLVSRKRPELRLAGWFCLLYFLFFWASSRVRLRYLMPIYPFLSILTAYVLANGELKGKKVLALTLLLIAFQLNLYWAVVYINSTKPFDFLTGKTTRTAFLREHIAPYPVFEYANAMLPTGARILFLYGGKFGNDGYYLNHDYVFHAFDLSYPVRNILTASSTPEDVHKAFIEQGITHLLVNGKLLQFDLSASLDEKEQALFRQYAREFLSLECAYAGTALYRLW